MVLEQVLEVEFDLLQVKCINGRIQILKENYDDSLTGHQLFCSGCPFEKQKSLNKCFGI